MVPRRPARPRRARRPLVAGAPLCAALALALLRAAPCAGAAAPPPLRVAVIDQFYPGDDAFADERARQFALLLNDAVDIDGDGRRDPYYHGDVVRLFLESPRLTVLPCLVRDARRPKAGIARQLRRLCWQVDLGQPLDAVLLCWESSTPAAAFDDTLRAAARPRYRQLLDEWGRRDDGWRATVDVIDGLEALTARGVTVVTITGNSGGLWVNTYAFARGVFVVGGAERDAEARWIAHNELVDAVARSVFPVRLVCDGERPAFGYDLDGDGRADVPCRAVADRDAGDVLPHEPHQVLKGTSFAAPTALRHLADAGLLPPRAAGR